MVQDTKHTPPINLPPAGHSFTLRTVAILHLPLRRFEMVSPPGAHYFFLYVFTHSLLPLKNIWSHILFRPHTQICFELLNVSLLIPSGGRRLDRKAEIFLHPHLPRGGIDPPVERRHALTQFNFFNLLKCFLMSINTSRMVTPTHPQIFVYTPQFQIPRNNHAWGEKAHILPMGKRGQYVGCQTIIPHHTIVWQ